VSALLLDSAGNMIIEFTLALPVLSLMLVGMLDLGNYSLQKSAMLQGARQGAQYAILAPTDDTNIRATAKNATGLTGVTATNSLFCECVSGTPVNCSSSCSGGGTLKKYVNVQTSKTFTSVLTATNLSFGTLGHWTPPTSLSASVTMIVP
jgi:Flp pilus assembly protein TadG